MSKRLKILMSAYACEPGKGSEPEAGWQWATRLARWHDITVVTRVNNEPGIRSGLIGIPEPHPNFIFLDPPPFWQRWKKRGLPVQWYYILWQITVARTLRTRLSEFDLVHHVTFNAYRWPGIWWFSPSPVLLGPLGGGQVCPIRLLPLFGRKLLGELIRSLLIKFSTWNPLHRLTCRRAVALLIANKDTARRIPQPDRHKIIPMLDAGIEESPVANRSVSAKNSKEIRLIWVGVLDKRKGLPLALESLGIAARSAPQVRLTILGAGYDEQALRRMAVRLGVQNRVDWCGRQPRTQVERLMSEHDIFLFTSVRDTSGYVVLEAMLAGLPVITLNHQGAAEMTTDATALRIEPSTINRTASDLAQAIIKLAGDVELRQQLGRAGRERVLTHFAWSKKAEQMDAVYRSLPLGKRPTG